VDLKNHANVVFHLEFHVLVFHQRKGMKILNKKNLRGLKKQHKGSEFLFKNLWTFRLQPPSNVIQKENKPQQKYVLDESSFAQPCVKEEPLPVEWFDFSQLSKNK
jgi:hypothetical protein